MAFYSPEKKQIVLCCNRMQDISSIEGSLVHELVHAYDYIRWPEGFCKVRACSEIRAYHIQNVCKRVNGFLYNYYMSEDDGSTYSSLEECIKQHAMRSTKSICTKTYKKDIEQVYIQCFNDMTPIESRPRLEKMEGRGEFDPNDLAYFERKTSN